MEQIIEAMWNEEIIVNACFNPFLNEQPRLIRIGGVPQNAKNIL